jgi:DASS family divalent anion:Na+ symporter
MDVSPAKAPPPTNLTATKPAAPVGNLWKFLVPVGIGIVLWFAPVPAGLDTKAWHMFAVFVATIAGIMTAPLPIAAVAIIGATVGVFVGVVSFADVTKSTGTDLVWLGMLAFFISRGVIKTGLEKLSDPLRLPREHHHRGLAPD